ncbi:MAG: trehalose 6-phosphate phosphatase [Thermomicrobiales bacterium]|nr:trehalose 6-phosphate phosphatase [Thermomicrobiales bacterium]
MRVAVAVNTSEHADPVAQERVLEVLRLEPAGLFTDIDGTISAIAPTPPEAVVTNSAREALKRLDGRLALVGAVTGRAADDGAKMIGIPDLLVVGNHGMEWLHRGNRWVHPAAEASRASLAAALADVGAALAAAGVDAGVVLEDKRLSASIHYRLAPNHLMAREVILSAAGEAAALRGLRITEGRYVVELRPEVVINKGTAIADLTRTHSLNGVVYIGDDITDVDAFVAVHKLRESGAVAALAVAVLSAETHPSVSSMADVTVTGVGECIDLLTSVARALDGDGAEVK